MNDIIYEIKKELDHWKEVRDKYSCEELSDIYKENQRCAVDIFEVLRKNGIDVNNEMIK